MILLVYKDREGTIKVRWVTQHDFDLVVKELGRKNIIAACEGHDKNWDESDETKIKRQLKTLVETRDLLGSRLTFVEKDIERIKTKLEDGKRINKDD